MAIKLISALSTPKHIQFQNSSGTNTGKIEASGDDLVITNAVGDVLFGDVDSDVYIGDGVNNVNIIFEQSGSIKGENGGSATLTVGSSSTVLNLYNPQIANGMTLTSTMTIGSGGSIDFTPDTGVLLKFDGQTILERRDAGGALTLGHDNAVIIAGGDTSGVLNTNHTSTNETVAIGAEQGIRLYSWTDNDTSWSNREQWIFSDKMYFGQAADTNLYRSAANQLQTDDTFVVGGQLYITTVNSNTSSTTALVLNGTEVEKRTIGSLGFLSTINNGNWSGTDLSIANGGTGASSASAARTNLGLGSAATSNTSAFDAAGSAATALSDAQTWVGEQNYASDSAISTAVASYLPLAGGTITGATLVNAQLAVNSTTVNSVNKLEVHGQARINGKMMIGDSTISNVPNAAVQLHVKNAGQAGIRLEDSDSSNLAFDVIVNEGVGFLIKETVGGDSGDDIRLTIAESTGAVTIGGTISASNLSGTNTGDQTLPTLSSLGAAPLASPALTGTPTAPTAAAATNTTQLATTAFVSTAIANLSDSAPATLDTLNELAAALGDDANFSTTVTNSIATKLPKAGGTLTGGLTIDYAAGTNPLLSLFNDSNGNGAKINFSDQSTPSQNGTLMYVHSDGNSYGTGNAFVFSGTETTMNVVALGNLMYRDGIYKTPSSGTGAGTRKDANWDTAYGWGNHASAGYLTTHPSISAASSVNNSGRTYIQDITLDSNGHITAITSATETVVNTNTQLSDAQVRSKFSAGSNVSISSGGAISASNTDTVTSVGVSGSETTGTVTLTAAGGITLTQSGGGIEIRSSDSDTVYSHPTFNGDDIDIDTGALTGATVISDLDINITTNGEGHVTDANGSVSTRTLTLANLGYTGATNANYITNNNQLTNGAGYITGVTNISGYSGTLLRSDNRTISPSEETAGRMKFGFTSWGNNNTSPYADFLHLRSYTDSSGGKDNLVMFKKSEIGMRIWQQSFGSATAYSTYEDVYHTGNLTIGDGGLTQKNFTTTLKNKLDGIATSANNYSLPANIPATSVAIGSTVTLTESTDRADLLYINSSTSSWGGLQIGNTSNEFIFSLMGNGNAGGIYDDQNGDWIIYWDENAGVHLYLNGSQKLSTTSTGVSITGEIVTTGGNSTNWNTAYGWGNHASAGYSTASGVEDNANNYSLPAGSSSVRGGFKIGYTESGKNYPVEVSSEKMFVNVPWTDSNTNYYLNGITKSGNTLTFAISGATNQTYTFGSNAFNSTTYSTASGVEDNADVTDTANVVAALTAGTNVQIAANGTISATDTNTVYTHPTSAGNKHIPSGGAAGQFLKYSSSGTATWATPSYTTNTNTQLSNEQVQDIVGAMFSGNTETNITATYQDGDGTIDLSVAANYGSWDLVAEDDTTFRVDTTEHVKFQGASISGTGTSADPFLVNTADTNTTYTADGNYGMTLNGTAFRLENDRRRNSSTQDIYTGNTHDYTFYDADVGIRWYTAAAEEMRLENDGDLHVDGDVIAFSTTVSDERLKDDIQTIENATEKVSKLRGVSYTWNDGSRKGEREIGVIAQEVEQVVPEIVHEKKLPFVGDETYKTVDYEKLVALLIESNKEQQDIISQLEERIIDLENRL